MNTPAENLSGTAELTDSTKATDAAETLENDKFPKNVENEGNTENPENAVAVTGEVDDNAIKAAVEFINEKVQETIYLGSVEIGDYILEHFFGGDMELAKSKNPKKNASYRKLCDKEELLIHPVQLSAMVRVASQERYLKDKNVDVTQLTYTHKASLTKLKNDDQKLKLIDDCIQDRLSTRALDGKIDVLIEQLKSDSKKSIIRETAGYIKAIDKISKLDVSVLAVEKAGLSELNKKQRENLEEKLGKLRANAEEGSRKTEAIVNKCDALLNKLSSKDGNDQQDSE